MGFHAAVAFLQPWAACSLWLLEAVTFSKPWPSCNFCVRHFKNSTKNVPLDNNSLINLLQNTTNRNSIFHNTLNGININGLSNFSLNTQPPKSNQKNPQTNQININYQNTASIHQDNHQNNHHHQNLSTAPNVSRPSSNTSLQNVQQNLVSPHNLVQIKQIIPDLNNLNNSKSRHNSNQNSHPQPNSQQTHITHCQVNTNPQTTTHQKKVQNSTSEQNTLINQSSNDDNNSNNNSNINNHNHNDTHHLHNHTVTSHDHASNLNHKLQNLAAGDHDSVDHDRTRNSSSTEDVNNYSTPKANLSERNSSNFDGLDTQALNNILPHHYHVSPGQYPVAHHHSHHNQQHQHTIQNLHNSQNSHNSKISQNVQNSHNNINNTSNSQPNHHQKTPKTSISKTLVDNLNPNLQNSPYSEFNSEISMVSQDSMNEMTPFSYHSSQSIINDISKKMAHYHAMNAYPLGYASSGQPSLSHHSRTQDESTTVTRSTGSNSIENQKTIQSTPP